MVSLNIFLVLVLKKKKRNSSYSTTMSWSEVGRWFGISVLLLAIIKLKYLFQRFNSIWDGKPLNFVQKLFYIGMSEFSSYWHGLELHYPKSLDGNPPKFPKSTIIVGYHSRSTIDLGYVAMRLEPKVVIYHYFFDIPLASAFLSSLGGIASSSNKTGDEDKKHFEDEVTSSSRPLLVLPGGVYEMSKRYEDLFKVQWKKEPGFANVVVEYMKKKSPDVPNMCCVPFYTKNCERLYLTNPWWYDTSGQLFRYLSSKIKSGGVLYVPLLLTMTFAQMGFVLLPLPVKLDTYFGEPIYPEPNDTAESFASRVKLQLQELIDRTEALPNERMFTIRNRYVRALVVGLITLLQNFISYSTFLISFWILFPIALIGYSLFRLIFRKKRRTDKSEKNE